MRLALFGTGIMGRPIARNAARAGLEVRAWNRTIEKAKPLAEQGVEVVAEPAAAAASADLAVTMLSDAEAVRALVEQEGVLEALRGKVWAQMGTIGIAATEELAALAAERGVAYVDAPVLGTRQPAEAGELIVLAAGPPQARRRCDPLFGAIGKQTHWLADEPGAASRLKLALNCWILGLVEALAETLALAEGLEVDPRKLLAVIEGEALDSGYAQLKGRAMIERSFEPAFPLRLALKDAGLAIDAAEEAGMPLPVVEVAREQMGRAAEAGHGDEDLAATILALGRERPRARS